MKQYLHFWGLVASLFFCSRVVADDTISGTIMHDTTFARNVVIAKNFTVPRGLRLTVLPGVTVKAKRDAFFFVYGSIVAKGTALNPITFTAEKSAWEGIDIEGKIASNDSSIFEYCTITQAGDNWGRLGGALCIRYNNQIAIRHCQITENLTDTYGGGIYLEQSNARIEDCNVSYNGCMFNAYNGGGIGIAIVDSKPIISNTKFNNNTIKKDGDIGNGAGVYSKGSAARFINCQMNHNISHRGVGGTAGVGMYSESSNDTLINCQLIGNTGDAFNQAFPNFSGVGLYLYKSSAVLKHCAIDSNQCNLLYSSSGAGVYIQQGHSQFEHCSIKANNATSTAGVICANDSSVFSNCSIMNNTAIGRCGGVGFVSSVAQFINDSICNNKANIGAGLDFGSYAVYIDTYIPTFRNSVISDNVAQKSEGAAYLNDRVNPIFDNVRITGNKPNESNFGKILTRDTSFSGSATILDSLYVGNRRTIRFAAGTKVQFSQTALLTIKGRIDAQGTAQDSILFMPIDTIKRWQGIKIAYSDNNNDSSRINYCRFSYSYTAALKLSFTNKMSFSHNNITRCVSSSDGAGLVLLGTRIQINSCTFAKNHTDFENHVSGFAGSGGGVYVNGGINSFTDCLFANNYLPMSNSIVVGYGAGVYFYGGISTVNRCKFLNNGLIDSRHSGGAFAAFEAEVHLSNSLISGNIADDGAAFHTNKSKVSLMNCTITNNERDAWYGATSGIDSYINPDTLSFINCIVGHPLNTLPKSCITTVKNCIFPNDTTRRTANASVIHKPAAFVSPLDYDYRISNWSPAINAGQSQDAPSDDITGRSRTGLPDIGAYEWDGATTADPSKITAVKLNYNRRTLVQGDTMQLKASVEPRFALNSEFFWRYKPNNKTLLLSDKTKAFTANKSGTLVVYAKSSADSLVYDSCIVTVIVPLTGIAFNTKVYTTAIAQTLKIYPTLQPSYTTEPKLVCTIADPSIARIDSLGNVYTLAAGTSKIYYRSIAHPSIMDSCTLVVNSIIPTKLSLNYHNKTMGVGTEFTQYIYTTPSLANADYSFRIKGSQSVANVDSTGKIKALAPGSVYVITSSKSNPSLKDSIAVRVDILITKLSFINHDTTVGVGQVFATKRLIEPSNTTQLRVMYKCLDASVAEVDTMGVVHSIAPGTARIAVFSYYSYAVADTILVTVVSQTATDIKFTEHSVSLLDMQLHQFHLTAIPTLGNVSGTFSIKDSKYGRFLNNGLFLAFNTGKTMVYFTSSIDPTLKDSCEISVQSPVKKIHIVGGAVKISTKQAYAASISYEPYYTPQKGVVFSVKNTNVAKATDIGASSVAAGVTMLYATSTFDPSVKDSIVLTITDADAIIATAVNFERDTIKLTVGESFSSVVKLTPSNTTQTGIQYRSKNSSIASVDTKGIISALAAGSTVVYAENALNMTLRDSLTVIISAKPVSYSMMSTEAIRVYPQPAHNMVMIDYDGQTAQEIALYSMSGELLTTAQSQNSIDVSNVANGMYLLIVRFKDAGEIQQLILKE